MEVCEDDSTTVDSLLSKIDQYLTINQTTLEERDLVELRDGFEKITHEVRSMIGEEVPPSHPSKTEILTKYPLVHLNAITPLAVHAQYTGYMVYRCMGFQNAQDPTCVKFFKSLNQTFQPKTTDYYERRVFPKLLQYAREKAYMEFLQQFDNSYHVSLSATLVPATDDNFFIVVCRHWLAENGLKKRAVIFVIAWNKYESAASLTKEIDRAFSENYPFLPPGKEGLNMVLDTTNLDVAVAFRSSQYNLKIFPCLKSLLDGVIVTSLPKQSEAQAVIDLCSDVYTVLDINADYKSRLKQLCDEQSVPMFTDNLSASPRHRIQIFLEAFRLMPALKSLDKQLKQAHETHPLISFLTSDRRVKRGVMLVKLGKKLLELYTFLEGGTCDLLQGLEAFQTLKCNVYELRDELESSSIQPQNTQEENEDIDIAMRAVSYFIRYINSFLTMAHQVEYFKQLKHFLDFPSCDQIHQVCESMESFFLDHQHGEKCAGYSLLKGDRWLCNLFNTIVKEVLRYDRKIQTETIPNKAKYPLLSKIFNEFRSIPSICPTLTLPLSSTKLPTFYSLKNDYCNKVLLVASEIDFSDARVDWNAVFENENNPDAFQNDHAMEVDDNQLNFFQAYVNDNYNQ